MICRCVLHSLTIIPHPLEFVKRFLKSFSKNFSVSFSLGAEVLVYYITSLFICQEVFQKFFQLFSWSFSRPSLHRLSTRAARWQLAYYSTSPSICQHLFLNFFHFGIGGRSVQILGIALVHYAQYNVNYTSMWDREMRLSHSFSTHGASQIGNLRFAKSRPHGP